MIVITLATTAHAQKAFTINGILSARGVNASGPPSWLERDFGRLEAGGDRNEFFATAQIGADWTPTSWFTRAVAVCRRAERPRRRLR